MTKQEEIKIIEVPDKELRKAGEDNAYNLYQGDLFRGYIVKGVVRDDAHKTTYYLVTKNPKGRDCPVKVLDV